MNNPFWIHGRIRRLHYILIVLGLGIVNEICVWAADPETTRVTIFTVLPILTIWPATTLAVQRAHDIGRSALLVAVIMPLMVISAELLRYSNETADEDWDLLGVVAKVGIIIVVVLSIYLTFSRGQVGVNRYGSDPRLGSVTP